MYIYLKTHRVTGLKYLGITSQDPFRYKGSGTRWNNHIRKHRYDVETVILFETQCQKELEEKCLYYSELWQVAKNKKEWANLMPENGKTGFVSGEYNPSSDGNQVSKKNLKWYNNGISTIYVTEGTQPEGFVRGRAYHSRKDSESTIRKRNAAISRANKNKIPVNRRVVISPSGELFVSIKAAAAHCNMTISQFKYRNVENGNWVIR